MVTTMLSHEPRSWLTFTNLLFMCSTVSPETSRGLANVRLSHLLPLQGLSTRQGNSVCRTAQPFHHQQPGHAVRYPGILPASCTKSYLFQSLIPASANLAHPQLCMIQPQIDIYLLIFPSHNHKETPVNKLSMCVLAS